MRILVVHEVEFVDKVVYEWQEFPEVLARVGHDVSVLDYDSSSDWSDIRRWGAGPKRVRVPYRLDPSREVDLFRMIGPPVAGVRRLYAAAAARRVARRVIDTCRPDVVLLYAVPTCGLAILSAARRAGIPVVFRSIDVLSQLVPSAIAFGVHVLERRVYPGCERVLVANPSLGEYVHRMSRGRARIRLLKSPVDTDRFVPRRDRRDQVRARLGIPDAARLAVFVGSLFTFVGLEGLLESWERVLAIEPAARLLIVGGGPDEARLRRMSERLGHAGSVTFTGMRPYDEIPELISSGDVGLCPFEVLPVTRDVNPIKVMQYLSCEVPCVCTPLPGTSQLLTDRESGVVYAEPGTPFADTLGALLSDPVECERLGLVGRDWVIRNHSFPTLTEQLERELAEAIEDFAASR